MKKVFVLAVTASLLASCNQSVLPHVPTISQTAIPAYQSQALVLNAALAGSEITPQNAANLSMRSIMVEDFDGAPFYYLTLTTNTKAADFWAALHQVQDGDRITATGASVDRNLYGFEVGSDFARKLADLQQAITIKRLVSPQAQLIYAEDTQGNYWSVLTGQPVPDEAIRIDKEQYAALKTDYLSTPRDISSMREAWKALDASLQPQATALHVQGGALPLVTSEGNLNIAAVVSTLSSEKPRALQTGSDVSSSNWLGWINHRTAIAGVEIPAGDAYALGDYLGTADTSGYAKNDFTINGKPYSLAPFNKRTFGNGRSINIGNRLDVYQWDGKSDFGNSQWPTQRPYSLSATDAAVNWGMRPFYPWASPYLLMTHMGCVPVSFLRMITMNANYGANASKLTEALKTTYNAAYQANKGIDLPADQAVAYFLNDMAKPVQADSLAAGYMEPRVSQMFATGTDNGNGTSATVDGMMQGTSKLLNNYLGNRFYLVGGQRASFANLTLPSTATNSLPHLSFEQFTYAIRDAVRQVIHDDDSAIEYIYITDQSGTATTSTSGHSAVSSAYRVYEHVGYSDVFVYHAPALGDPYVSSGGWINITNRWSTNQGAVGFRARN